MEIQKSEAEKLLDVSSTTYILQTDLEKMASAMGKKIRNEEPVKKEQAPEPKAEESASFKKKEEQFDLMVKVKQQEEQIKSSTEIANFYKEQSTVLLTQQQEAKTQINTMYLQMIKVTNKATAFGVTAIALGVILIVFIVLVVLGKLQF